MISKTTSASMASVDKSLFIKYVLDSPTKIKAFVKPSRFGKTTAMRLLCEFLSLDSDGASVEHKAICSVDGGRCLAFKRCPVCNKKKNKLVGSINTE